MLRRRVVIVAGKGGTGRSTVAAALSLLGARAGKRVLAVDVEATGDLSRALGSRPAGFKPTLLQPNISGISLHAEESFQEYLSVYFKVPRMARLTPLARVFDFIATGVPGPRDMLVVGKIAFEEKRRDGNRAAWDLIVVDAAASGHAVSHLAAAHAMLTLVKGGVIRGQVQWIDDLVRDAARCCAVITALPQEMPVVEALELRDKLRQEAGIAVAAAVMNQMVMQTVSSAQRSLAKSFNDDPQAEAVRARLGGDPAPLIDALELAARLHERSLQYERQLRSRATEPVLRVPLISGRQGLAITRAVADALLREGA